MHPSAEPVFFLGAQATSRSLTSPATLARSNLTCRGSSSFITKPQSHRRSLCPVSSVLSPCTRLLEAHVQLSTRLPTWQDTSSSSPCVRPTSTACQACCTPAGSRVPQTCGTPPEQSLHVPDKSAACLDRQLLPTLACAPPCNEDTLGIEKSLRRKEKGGPFGSEKRREQRRIFGRQKWVSVCMKKGSAKC